jgi:phage shock protein PspC (stress-responsive transcriptional regulator)
MICYNCQKEIMDGAKYCQHCGAAQKPLTPPPGPQKPLRRSRKNKVIAGVCAGLADYFNIDMILVRLIWVLVVLFSGIFPGVIAYFICWLVIPYAEDAAPAPAPPAPVSQG